MKIVEALKKLRAAQNEIQDLTNLIKKNAAHYEGDTSLGYDKPAAKIQEWTQAVFDIMQNMARIRSNLQHTNLMTFVSVEVEPGKVITKTISEWVVRRREGVDTEIRLYQAMETPLKQKAEKDSAGNIILHNVVKNYSVEQRDKKLLLLSREKVLIDSALEIANATTDLLQAY